MHPVMSRSPFALALLCACSGATSVVSPGGGDAAAGSPLEVSFETFNVALRGPLTPNESTRRPAVFAALSAYSGDVLCVQDAWQGDDPSNLVAATKSSFPYSLRFPTTLGTEPDDRTTAFGTTPARPTLPPCGAPSDSSQFDDMFACLRSNCSTPGDNGVLTSRTCIEQRCGTSLLRFKVGATARCYGSLLAGFASPMATLAHDCKTELHGDVGYSGRNGVVLLSRFPLSSSAHYVFASTWEQRVVIAARIAFPNGAQVDTYCTALTPIREAGWDLYTGDYGGGATDTSGWEAEQRLQAERLVAWVKGRSSRAVLLGDFGASPTTGNVQGFGGLTWDLLASEFVLAAAPGTTARCTSCVGNPNATTAADRWLDHVWLYGFKADVVHGSTRTFLETRADATDGSGKVPLSDRYGFRSVLTVAP